MSMMAASPLSTSILSSASVAPLSPVRPSAAKVLLSSPSATTPSNGNDNGEDDDWRDNLSFQSSPPLPIIPPSPSSNTKVVASSAAITNGNGHNVNGNGMVKGVTLPNGSVVTPIVVVQQANAKATPTPATAPTLSTNGNANGNGHNRSVSDVTSLATATTATAKVEKKSLFKNILGGFGSKKSTTTTPVKENKRDNNSGSPSPSPLVTQSSASTLHTRDHDDSPLSPTSTSTSTSSGKSISGNMASFASAIAGSSPFALFRKKKGDVDEWLPRVRVRYAPHELVVASMSLPCSELVTALYPSLSSSLLWRFSLLAAALPPSATTPTSSTTNSAASSRQHSRRPSLHTSNTTTHHQHHHHHQSTMASPIGLPIMTMNGVVSPHPPAHPPPSSPSPSLSPPPSMLSSAAITPPSSSTLSVPQSPFASMPSLLPTSMPEPLPVPVMSEPLPLSPRSLPAPFPGFVNSNTNVLPLLSSSSPSQAAAYVTSLVTRPSLLALYHGYAVPTRDTSSSMTSLRLGYIDDMGNYELCLVDDVSQRSGSGSSSSIGGATSRASQKVRDQAREIIFGIRRDAEQANRTAAIDDVTMYKQMITPLQHTLACAISSSNSNAAGHHRRSSSSSSSAPLVVRSSPSFDTSIHEAYVSSPSSSNSNGNGNAFSHNSNGMTILITPSSLSQSSSSSLSSRSSTTYDTRAIMAVCADAL